MPDESTAPDLDELAADLRSASTRLNRRLRAEGGTLDLTPTQTSVISRLHNGGPATTSDLARAEGMRPQSMSATVAALETAGAIERRPDPKDGRATLVHLTDQAYAMVAEHRAAKQGWLAREMRDRLDVDEQRTLAAATAIIDRLLAPSSP